MRSTLVRSLEVSYKQDFKQDSGAAWCEDDLSRSPVTRPAESLMDPSERTEMIEQHWDVGKRLAWSLLSGWRIRMSTDEVSSIVGAALCEAAARFDPLRGVGFKTFLFYYLRGTLLKEISRIVNEKRIGDELYEMSLSASPGNLRIMLNQWPFCVIENDNPEKLVARRQLSMFCRDACSKLDELEREVVLRHYVHDESLKAIAAALGYCRCHISRVKTAALEKLGAALMNVVDLPEAKPALQTSRSAMYQRKFGAVGGDAESIYTGGRGRSRAKKRYDERRAEPQAACAGWRA